MDANIRSTQEGKCGAGMMPAGTYYIGDLCYVMDTDEWDQFCSITISGMNCLSGEFNMPDGRRFATYGTKWGDGEYRDQYGNQYGVDAGLIGCIRLDDIRHKPVNIGSLGAVITFQNDFDTSYADGVINIGHIHIDTDPVYEEEYDE